MRSPVVFRELPGVQELENDCVSDVRFFRFVFSDRRKAIDEISERYFAISLNEVSSPTLLSKLTDFENKDEDAVKYFLNNGIDFREIRGVALSIAPYFYRQAQTAILGLKGKLPSQEDLGLIRWEQKLRGLPQNDNASKSPDKTFRKRRVLRSKDIPE